MARITMEINTFAGVDPAAVQQWIGDGLALEQSELEQQESRMVVPRYSATAVNALPAPRKVGRKTNAEKAAEREAAEVAQSAQSDQLSPHSLPTDVDLQPAETQQQQTSAPLPPTGGAAFPPGIAPPGAHPQGNGAAPPAAAQPPIPPGVTLTPPPTQQQPIPAAMPKSEPLPPAENGIMRLDEFRTASLQVQKARPGKMNLLMRAGIWPSDRSAKDSWFTIDAVPPEFRMRLFDEIDLVP